LEPTFHFFEDLAFFLKGKTRNKSKGDEADNSKKKELAQKQLAIRGKALMQEGLHTRERLLTMTF
jgi:hypothetical protein